MQSEQAQYQKLVNCFERTFPDLDPSVIPNASQDTVKNWDSIAQVTLLSLIGEEFEADIDFEEFENATSFAKVLEVVRSRINP